MSETTSGYPPLSEVEAGTLTGLPYRALRRSVGFYLRHGLRVANVGLERVPMSGPLLYVSNHLHFFDPAIEFFAFPRRINFMGKKEAFENPVFRTLAVWSGGFPVDRGKVDRAALRHAEARLHYGKVVGIYPEGGRSPTGALIAAKDGAGLLALKTGVPVLPVAITGSERLRLNGSKGQLQEQHARPEPGHAGVRITYGDPFLVPREHEGRKIGPREATDLIMLTIAALLPESYQGVYADKLAQSGPLPMLPYSSQES